MSFLSKLLLLTFILEANGQNALIFQNFSLEQGLSNNTVNHILQDSYGYVWIGTGNGLNRFDGYKVEKVPFEENTEINSKHNVYCLYEDRNSNLIVGTDKGLYRFMRKTGKIQLECGSDERANRIKLSNYAIRAIVKDNNENIWVGTFNGLNRISPNGDIKIYKHDDSDANSINSNIITCLFTYDDNLLIGTNDGFSFYNEVTDNFERVYHYSKDDLSNLEQKIVTCIEKGSGSTIYIGSWGLGLFEFNMKMKEFVRNHTYDSSKENCISGNTIFALKYDKEENLWIGTENGGLNRFEEAKSKFTIFTHEDYFYDNLAGNTIKCISTDNHGDLWIGTYQGGISKLDFNKIKLNHYQHLYNTPSSLSNNKITSFVENKPSDIWIGTDGGGINRFDPGKGTFQHIKHSKDDPYSLKTNIILSLGIMDNGEVWAGTYNEGINVLDKNGRLLASHKMKLEDSLTLSGNNICSVFQDSKSRIWVGVSYRLPCLYIGNGNFIRINYPVNSNHAIQDVRDFHEDSKGNIWIGSNGYLFRLDSVVNTKLYFKKFNIFQESNNNYITTITSIEEDKENNLWIGTKGRGLIKFETKTGKSKIFTLKNGLPTNNIESLTYYQDGSLWSGTTEGLIQVNTDYEKEDDELILRSYDSHDGLQGDVFNVNAVLNTEDNMLLFGGNNGFNAFYPWKLEPNENVPPVYITGLQINHQDITNSNDILDGRTIMSTDVINLDYKENTVSLFFTAIDLKNSEKVVYRYKLEGFEENWNYAGIERKATYTNLATGDYTFRVQAANSDGKWNRHGTSLTILISPPWWQTYWALGIYIFVVTTVILAFRKFLLKKERKKNELSLEKIKVEKERELNDMKVQFFTNISHELRTPLTLINGPIEELLAKWEYEPKQTLHLQLILRNSKRLFQLVDQLMDFRKIENETLPYSPSRAELVSLIKIIFADFNHLASNKNIDYRFT
ncbi:MAG TPA: two-component regulator propeller domain-containing protein, partial [Bacteroidales bacterium]|nr:two-component regulator propeller domain-containing protein [Bacteroidales bacterium]